MNALEDIDADNATIEVLKVAREGRSFYASSTTGVVVYNVNDQDDLQQAFNANSNSNDDDEPAFKYPLKVKL